MRLIYFTKCKYCRLMMLLTLFVFLGTTNASAQKIPATIKATITTSPTTLVFGTPYTLTATIDSKTSQGDLLKSQMVISIPAGQEYVAGSASLKYPMNSPMSVSVPPAVEAQLVAILADASTRGNTREFTMKIFDLIGKNVLPGSSDPTITDPNKGVELTLTFLPMCETLLTGIYFEGNPSGEDASRELAIGSGTYVRSAEMLSAVIPDYEFSVDLQIVSGNRAFNEIRKEDQLRVEIAKTSGRSQLKPTDALNIHMPKNMDLVDPSNIIINSTDLLTVNETRASVRSNSISGETRIIVIDLPFNAINLASSGGINKELSFLLDIVHTPNNNDTRLVNNPENTIKAIVTADMQFDPTCTIFAPMTIGSDNVDIALVTASDNPYQGEMNKDLAMDIISSGFAGQWFDVASGGTALSSVPTYKHTPTSLSQVTFYVSSVFNSVDYGRVPVLATGLRSLDFTLSSPITLCKDTEIDLSTLVSGFVPGITFKYYSDAACMNEVTNPRVTANSSTSYFVKSTNGTIISAAKEIILTVLAPTAITTQPVASNINANSTITFSVVASGDNLTYQWKKDGVNISGATAATYTKTNAVEADKGYYSVVVTGSCGNVTSNNAQLGINPLAEASITSANNRVCANSQADITITLGGTAPWTVVYTDGSQDHTITATASPYTFQVLVTKETTYTLKSVTDAFANGNVSGNPTTIGLSNFIVQKWNNTLVANNNSSTNGGHNFVSYKWFRNGTLIDERPYHTVGTNATNTLEMGVPYTVEVTTDKGETFTACPYFPVLRHASAKLYPTIVNVSEPIYLEVETEDGSNPNGKIDIYNVSGASFKSPKVSERVTPITLPSTPGIYVVKFKSTEINQDFKVIVK